MSKKNKKKSQGAGQQFLSPEQYIRQKARTLEIGTCYVTNDIEKVKMGHVIVTRRHTGGRISIAVYLVDMACLGVKDSFFQLRMEDYEFDEFLDDRRDMFRECSYEEAHNRIWGSIAYAEEAGIAPDKSFLLTQYMLEEDTDDVPLIEYEYGRDGKHFLTCRSELEASRYLPLLRKNLGEGNYHYIVGIGDPGFDNDDYDDDYDEEITTIHELPIDHLDMADIAAFHPKAIRCLSHDMGLGFEHIEDEGEMYRQYVDYILQHPEELLSRLPQNELDILLFLYANHDKSKGVPTANTELTLFMEMAGVADTYWNHEDEYCIRVADDFQRVALPLAAGVRMSDEARSRYEVEAIVEGLANLYGEITVEDALCGIVLGKGVSPIVAAHLMKKALERSLLLNYIVGRIDETNDEIDHSFTSRYYDGDPAELRKANAEKGKAPVGISAPMPARPFTDSGARRFTIEEIKEAGSGEVPTIPNERQKEFWHFLAHELKWDDYYARRICFELWYKVNHDGDTADEDGETIEEYFENEALSLDDITTEEREKGMRLLADYVAHIPRWTLKGHSPSD